MPRVVDVVLLVKGLLRRSVALSSLVPVGARRSSVLRCWWGGCWAVFCVLVPNLAFSSSFPRRPGQAMDPVPPASQGGAYVCLTAESAPLAAAGRWAWCCHSGCP